MNAISDPKNTKAISIKEIDSIDQKRYDDEILGLAVMRPDLYVLWKIEHQHYHIEWYNCYSLKSEKKVFKEFKGFGRARDMICCDVEKKLYISDEENRMVHEIKLPLTDPAQDLKGWSTEYEPESLSMTHDKKILVTFFRASKLIVYTTGGVREKEISLQSLEHPWHAVYSREDLLLVSIKGTMACNCSSCVYSIDQDGKGISAIFVGMYDTQQCNSGTCRMAASPRYVLAADNKKIVILDSNMETKLNEINFNFPSRLCLDDERFYVASNADGGKKTITIFELSIRPEVVQNLGDGGGDYGSDAAADEDQDD